ncbi:MAG: PD40 domain-containing protein [Nitrospirae bacterium]|nr:PD40 domain-containing protein [Nitrospirota bacterium]
MRVRILFLAVIFVCFSMTVLAEKEQAVEGASETLIAEINFPSWIKESLKISPDGKRAAYVVFTLDRKQFVDVDDKEGKRYDGILMNTPVFSPDSRRMAYAGQTDKKWIVVIDGKEEKQYDNIGAGSVTFSPDSKRAAYAAELNGKWFAVIDGKEEKQYDGIGFLVFSSDDKRIAYAAKSEDKWFAVIVGKEEKQY